MGTYFPLSNNQRDAATMLYLKDPAPTSHSSTPILSGNTIMYMNFPPSSEPFSDAIAGNSHSHTTCMDAPPVASNSNASSQEVLLNFGGSRALENQLNTWKDGRNEMLMMHQAGVPNLQGQGQGLSLSLSTHVPLHVPYQNEGADFSSILGSNALMHGEDRGRNISFENEDSFAAGVGNADGASDISSYGMPGVARAVPNSKYLRAAQELLDEVVNVKKAIKEQNARKESRRESREMEGDLKDGGSDPSASYSATPKGNGASSHVEVSAAEKQELQNKLTKLLTMLDEVRTNALFLSYDVVFLLRLFCLVTLVSDFKILMRQEASVFNHIFVFLLYHIGLSIQDL